jgi:hypothetical protein
VKKKHRTRTQSARSGSPPATRTVRLYAVQLYRSPLSRPRAASPQSSHKHSGALVCGYFKGSCGDHGSPGSGGGREPPGTQGARGWPGVGPGSGLTSPGPGPGSTLNTAPGGAALTSFFRRLWCLSALRLTSIARALRRLSFFATSCVASLLVLPSSLRLFFGDPPREK